MGALSLTIALLVVPGGATAQGTDAFDYSRFQAQPTRGYDILNVSTSQLLRHLELGAGLFFLYEDDPLTVVQDEDHDQVVARAVDQRIVGEVALGFGFFDHFSLAVAMPMVLSQGGDDLELFGRPGDTLSGAAVGDLRVFPKVRVLDPASFGGIGLHLSCPVAIPTGDQDSFLSDGGVSFTPTLGMDYRTESQIVVAFNIGYRVRPERVLYNYVSDDSLEWGIGLSVPVVPELLTVQGTTFGSVDTAKSLDPVDFAEKSDTNGLTVEGALALQLQVVPGLAVTAGVGGALLRGVGSPDVRAFLAIDWAAGEGPQDTDLDGIFDPDDKCPEKPEDKDGFEDEDGCPELDNDGDGIPDKTDGCPNEAEDKDGFEDQDGCPDPDNDLDGVPDAEDKCPAEKEDQDGFDDGDGCPDPDNDKDGLDDVLDKCPNEAEDKDGVMDGDGCPETDADGDGVPDEKDKCGDRPETKNGIKDDDGCPDTKSVDVDLAVDAIKIRKPVVFTKDTDTILATSYAILDEVAEVLRDNKYITGVRVEGHSDSEGSNEDNLRITQQQAEAVVKYLVSKGIAAERLEAKGFGEEQPIASNMTPYGRSRNRRVEFKITSAFGNPVEPVEAAPKGK
ncbi:MAG: hypothetical protein EP329_22320 [Deltaproteobacteria bacterium]|nr:MAG: hypothetical protein EP329_22320 [Deltaproteobacteria bacterium]